MKNIVRVLLCAGLAVLLSYKVGKTMKLDTSLFLNRYHFKTLESMSNLLSSMDVNDLTIKDIYTLSAYAGLTPKQFIKEYVVVF